MNTKLGKSGTVAGAPVAQSAEQRPFKSWVPGSKPGGGTTLSPAQLPPRMRTKIQLELCPRPELPGFCWAWTGCLNSSGYGCVGIDGKRLLSHRAAYTLLVGQIPAGLQLDHLCRNITCCNPGHLDPVTGKTNCERSDPATKLRCINGHPLVGPNLYIKSLPNGLTKRECRTCRMLMLSRADDSRGRKRRPSESVAIRRARMLAESEAVLRSGELSA